MKKPIAGEEAIRVIETLETLPLNRRVEIFRDLTPEAREELIQSCVPTQRDSETML